MKLPGKAGAELAKRLKGCTDVETTEVDGGVLVTWKTAAGRGSVRLLADERKRAPREVLHSVFGKCCWCGHPIQDLARCMPCPLCDVQKADFDRILEARGW